MAKSIRISLCIVAMTVFLYGIPGLLLLLIIRPDFLVIEDHTHCHEPDHMSKMLVASLRYLALPRYLPD
jgi:hypothetical protein